MSWRVAFALVLLLAGPALATESICPGGSSPRSDITWCSDFDNLSNCTTGSESLCWQDNHFGDSPEARQRGNYLIVGGGGAVGNGYVRGRPTVGGTGSGNNYLEPVPGMPTSAFNLRYYIRYSRGYLSFYSGHNIQVEGTDAGFTGCGVTLKFQLSTTSGITYRPGSCGTVSSFFLPANKGTFTPLKNGRWYLVELQGIIDTSCSNVNDPHGCNGIVRVWLDEQLITEYTDVNLGGVATSGRFQWNWRALIPEMYYHYAVPPWSFEVAWDNMAFSNTGTYIGPAANENARGTGDPASPYGAAVNYAAWIGHRPQGDCSQGYNEMDQLYRSGGALQTTVTHGLFTDGCAGTVQNRSDEGMATAQRVNTLYTITDGATSTDCTTGGGANTVHCRWTGSTWVQTTATDAALGVTLTNASDGGGVYKEREDGFIYPQWASYGWIYLPSSNNYTTTNLALAGFTNSPSNPTSGYVALSVSSSGKWAVDQKNTSGTHGALISTTAVTYDTWHEYELMLWNDNTVSLMIDRARMYTRQALPLSAAWAFAGTLAPWIITGVIDFQGTPPFSVYYDDTVATTVSAWSSDGWGTENPFEGQSLPSTIRGITVRSGVTIR